MKILFSFLIFILKTTAFASALVYAPENLKNKTARVVIVMHGCLQTPESMALGSGWNALADVENLVVIYPRVPQGSNSMDCWGWFDPENQKSDSGQLYEIQKQVSAWKKRLKIPKAQVYAVGISSGAATVAGLLSCFPGDFAGGAIHSGPSYGLANSVTLGSQILTTGPLGLQRQGDCNPADFQKPLIILHGNLDVVVNPLHVKRLTEDFFSSFSYEGLHNREANGLIYSELNFAQDSLLMGRVIFVYGLGHAWSGSSENIRSNELLSSRSKYQTELPFFSDRGPNATELIMDFFNSAGHIEVP